MLRITLHINDEPIGDYQVLNVGQMGGDSRHTYSVSPIIDGDHTGEVIFSLTHLRELGAKRLAARVLEGLAEIADVEGEVPGDAAVTRVGPSTAPWTLDQLASLNAYQSSGKFHPFTCVNGHGNLTAGAEGWWCYQCDYKQNWAHRWMTDWSWRET